MDGVKDNKARQETFEDVSRGEKMGKRPRITQCPVSQVSHSQ